MAVKIADVIKYEGDNSTFVWKSPLEDFNYFTQLIVHESQEALFFMNGEALDLFGPGRHTLKTQNIPLISKAVQGLTGGENMFHCEVYYINKVDQMAIKWGTDSRVQFMEPTYGFPLSIGASGEMALKADNSRKLIVKLVGTEGALTQASLVSKFRAFLNTRVKAYLAQTIREKGISIFQIDEYLNEISDSLKEKLIGDFAEYGLSLEKFLVSNIARPDGEAQYEKFKQLYFRQYADIAEAKLRQQVNVIDAETAAKKTVIESQALAQKRAQEGYTYQQERGFDVASKVAENESVGQFTSLGVGLGTMAGVGSAVGGTINNAMGSMNSPTPAPAAQGATSCAKCGAQLAPGAKFCPECGEKVVVAQNKTFCPECGAPVAAGAKFCPECGKKLNQVSKCPECGTEVAPGTKFCPECGHKM